MCVMISNNYFSPLCRPNLVGLNTCYPFRIKFQFSTRRRQAPKPKNSSLEFSDDKQVLSSKEFRTDTQERYLKITLKQL